MDIYIKPAGIEDIPTLNLLNREVQDLHHRLHPHIFKPGTDDAMTDVFGGFLTNEAVTVCMAVDAQGQALAYTAFELVKREERSFRYGYNVLVVHHLAVSKASHGLGIGKLLMEAVDAQARKLGVTSIELGVWAQNTAAVGFYERLGFQRTYQTMAKPLLPNP